MKRWRVGAIVSVVPTATAAVAVAVLVALVVTVLVPVLRRTVVAPLAWVLVHGVGMHHHRVRVHDHGPWVHHHRARAVHRVAVGRVAVDHGRRVRYTHVHTGRVDADGPVDVVARLRLRGNARQRPGASGQRQQGQAAQRAVVAGAERQGIHGETPERRRHAATELQTMPGPRAPHARSKL